MIYGAKDPMEKVAEFSALGVIFRRGNFDGTHATKDRMLGGVGPFDLTQVREGIKLTEQNALKYTGILGLGVDDKHYTVPVIFDTDGAVADITAVTVAETVAAINTALALVTVGAGNLGEWLEAEVLNNALNIKVKSGKESVVSYTQAFGYLAGALGFGGGKAFHGLGSFFRNYVTDDDVITASRADQRTDDQKIEQMGGGRNTSTSITITGEKTGSIYSVNVKPRDLILVQMFEGGELLLHPEASNKPHSYRLIKGTEIDAMIEMYRLAPMYPANQDSKQGQEIGVVMEHVYAGAGSIGDRTDGAMTLSSFNYTIDAGAYNLGGRTITQPEELEFNKALWLTEKLLPTVSNEWTLEELYGGD